MASFCEIAVTRYLDSMQVSCIALPLLGPQPLAALELCPMRLFCVEGLSSLLLKLVCFLRIQVGVWGCKWREWKINVWKVTCCRKKSAIMVITVQFKIWNVWDKSFFYRGWAVWLLRYPFKEWVMCISGVDIDSWSLLLLWSWICSVYYENIWYTTL